MTDGKITTGSKDLNGNKMRGASHAITPMGQYSTIEGTNVTTDTILEAIHKKTKSVGKQKSMKTAYKQELDKLIAKKTKLDKSLNAVKDI